MMGSEMRAWLDEHVEEADRERVLAFWEASPGLPDACLGYGEDRLCNEKFFQVAWSYEDVYVEICFLPDGRYHWYVSPLRGAAFPVYGSDDPVAVLPPEFYAGLERVRAHKR